MKYNDVLELARQYDCGLLATDPRFRGTAEVSHEDGSYFKWRNAFMMKKEKFIIVFTEHFAYHVFDEDDLISFRHCTLGHIVTELDIEELKV